VIRENLDRILEGLEPGHVEVLADDRIELGGCLLDTPSETWTAASNAARQSVAHAARGEVGFRRRRSPARVIRYLNAVRRADLTRRLGSVSEYHGLIVESIGPDVFVGELCEVHSTAPTRTVLAEVIGIRNGRVLLMPYEDLRGVTHGAEVVATGALARAGVGDELLGRIVDAFGAPLDSAAPPRLPEEQALYPGPINPLARTRIDTVLQTGVRAIDTMLTIGRGQRVAIISGSGVGKSTLLGMIARNMDADVNVIALVGERGREVRHFIEDSLGPEGLKRSVVVVATSDQPALVRRRAAFRGDRDRRALPGARPAGCADDGFRDALRRGAARDRLVDRRAAHRSRLHADGIRLSAAPARAGRDDRERVDHGFLYRSRRGR